MSTEKTQQKIMDHIFMIDSTGSMSAAIKGAHDKATDLAINLRVAHPDVEFKFGAVCYRDPVDSSGDKNDFLDFVDDTDQLVEFLSTMQANGGGDGPEDFVGAFQIALNQMHWRDGPKAITIIADAPAHGVRFCGYENHEDQTEPLVKLLQEVAHKGIFMSGLSINGGAMTCFQECKKIYDEAGGPQFSIEDIAIQSYVNESMAMPCMAECCTSSLAMPASAMCEEAPAPLCDCFGGGLPAPSLRPMAFKCCARAAPLGAEFKKESAEREEAVGAAPSANIGDAIVNVSSAACEKAMSSFYK